MSKISRLLAVFMFEVMLCLSLIVVTPSQAKISHSADMTGITKLKKNADDKPFSRAMYSSGKWVNASKNCTIDKTLVYRALKGKSFKKNYCTYIPKQWKDPCSGILVKPKLQNNKIKFSVDIDHIIPLKYVNSHGGFRWSSKKKKKYGNSVFGMNSDLYIVVSSSANRSKGDKGPSKWQPAKSFYCTYAELWRKIARQWKIPLDPNDWDWVDNQLDRCAVTNSQVKFRSAHFLMSVSLQIITNPIQIVY
jgi:hypothetical protein